MPEPSRASSVAGPAKWAAVGLLGAASIAGIVASYSSARPIRPAPGRAPGEIGGAGAAPIGARTLNINRASAAELELLPEVGPALAARIVEYRDEHGPFLSVDELDRVKGIGPKTLAKIGPVVTVE